MWTEDGKFVCPKCKSTGEFPNGIKVQCGRLTSATEYITVYGDVDDEKNQSETYRVGTSEFTCLDCGHEWKEEEENIVVSCSEYKAMRSVIEAIAYDAYQPTKWGCSGPNSDWIIPGSLMKCIRELMKEKP